MSQCSVAQLLASELHARGVRRMFGVPGGGSSLDVIEAAATLGIDFVLARTESAAAMMAAATAELTGTLGVALTTKGPGTANGVNGVAYASLDRAPLLFLTDGFSAAEQAFVTHQVFDQRALLAPVTKGSIDLTGSQPETDLCLLLDLAMTPPYGPVLIELQVCLARRSSAACSCGVGAHGRTVGECPQARGRVRSRSARAASCSRGTRADRDTRLPRSGHL